MKSLNIKTKLHYLQYLTYQFVLELSGSVSESKFFSSQDTNILRYTNTLPLLPVITTWFSIFLQEENLKTRK